MSYFKVLTGFAVESIAAKPQRSYATQTIPNPFEYKDGIAVAIPAVDRPAKLISHYGGGGPLVPASE